MRVISGHFGGRLLSAPQGDGTRPTSDRVRGAVFSSLESQRDLSGARVADLFAGSGALGIEALSRGAESCVFVDDDRKACKIVEENLRALSIKDNAKIECARVEEFLSREPHRAESQFDIVFVDPPYEMDLPNSFLSILSRVVAPEGVVVFEHSAKRPDLATSLAPEGSGFTVFKTKLYGDTAVAFFVPEKKNAP